MTNLYETAMAAAKKALGSFLSAGAYQPGEAHLVGAAAGSRASTLDEDLDALLHEIQRRRGIA
ncbi:MAG: hypothetical protein NDI82_02855 [Anaeromyxobacteraceae bacterium]|nr:hypothetical protein [Anaeromyxobacteraceae bacterium]